MLIATAVIMIIPAPAYAYLDPGTGSMIIQIIVGAIAAALVSVKLAWAHIVSVLRAALTAVRRIGRRAKSNKDSAP
jgi:hypothetical protein